MPIEELPELEERLRRQPSWEPPLGFARRVVLLASTASEHWPPMYEGRRGRFVRAACIGMGAAAGVYVVLSLVSVTMLAVFRDVSYAVDGYSRLVELTARVISGHAVQVAWLSAVASLSLSASLVLRARA